MGQHYPNGLFSQISLYPNNSNDNNLFHNNNNFLQSRNNSLRHDSSNNLRHDSSNNLRHDSSNSNWLLNHNSNLLHSHNSKLHQDNNNNSHNYLRISCFNFKGFLHNRSKDNSSQISPPDSNTVRNSFKERLIFLFETLACLQWTENQNQIKTNQKKTL